MVTAPIPSISDALDLLYALFGLEGIERVWRGLECIKSPTNQNPTQSSPIPSNPLWRGLTEQTHISNYFNLWNSSNSVITLVCEIPANGFRMPAARLEFRCSNYFTFMNSAWSMIDAWVVGLIISIAWNYDDYFHVPADRKTASSFILVYSTCRGLATV